jgi:hypothetical protein
MSYIIDGPTLIGGDTTSNTLLGSLFFPSLNGVTPNSAAVGDMMYCDNVGGNGHQIVLPIGTVGQVLKVVASGPDFIPAWATDTNSIDDGFSALLTANQTILAAAATTPVNLQGFSATAPGFDTSGGWFASGQAAGLWTPGTAGKYRVSANVAFSNTDGTDASNIGSRTLTLVVNGSTYLTKTFQPTGQSLSVQQINFTTNLVLTATDTINVQLASSTPLGGMTVQANGTNLSVTRYV